MKSPSICAASLLLISGSAARLHAQALPAIARAQAEAPGRQATAPAQPPVRPPQSPPKIGQTPAPSTMAPETAPPSGPPLLKINLPTTSHVRLLGTSEVHLTGGVSISYQSATLSADRVDGNINRELVFTGNARIEEDGLHADADAIHFYPQDGSYRLDNPRAVLDPSVFNGQIEVPVFLSGGVLAGSRDGYTAAERFVATTCRERYHHYELRIASGYLEPHQRFVLRRVSVFFFGVKLITVPMIIVPLNERVPRRPRTNYLPEFGENYEEGYYARFPYTFAEGNSAGTFVRADITQKQGMGYRLEQEYLAGKQPSAYDTSGYGYGGYGGPGAVSAGAMIAAQGYGNLGARLPRLGTGLGPASGGLLTMQGYFSQGFQRNFNASFKHQQSIGGSNSFALDTELQQNSFLVSGPGAPTSSALSTRFDFLHSDATHGVNDGFTLNLLNNSSSGFSTSQQTADLKQAYQFGTGGSTRNSMSLDLDLAHSLTQAAAALQAPQRTETLDTEFSLQHIAREYSINLNADDNFTIGRQSGSTFGTLEKLPELLMSTDTLTYRRGWLKRAPLTLQFGVGEYSEPSTSETTDRILMGFTLQPIRVLTGRTEIVSGGGFEQHLYGDGAAQYLIQDQTTLRQHIAGRSGFDVRYLYEQPQGQSPFLFDQFQRAHSITAEAGYLEDRRFQLAAQVGYDLLGAAARSPWQSVSTRLMWRPTPSVRLDSTQTFDPNTGKFFGLTNLVRIRGRNGGALDFVTSIDPNQKGFAKKFTAINTQFDTPLGRSWRLTGLFRYNGLTGQFESRNLQITHQWDCLEASLTYTEELNTFRPVREFYLSIHILGLPFSRSFARGPAGETLGTGIGSF